MLEAVYMIPDPLNPRVAITLSTAFFESHPPSMLPKALHNGLSTATCVGHRSWCEWSISTQEASQAVREIIEMAYQP